MNPIKSELKTNGNGDYWVSVFESLPDSPIGIGLSQVGAENNLKIQAAKMHHSPYPMSHRGRAATIRGVTIE